MVCRCDGLTSECRCYDGWTEDDCGTEEGASWFCGDGTRHKVIDLHLQCAEMERVVDVK